MKKIYYILAVLLLIAVNSIYAQTTITLYPTTDVTISADQEDADINSEVFTCGIEKKVYWKDGFLVKKLVERRSLIKFDLSSIPQNANILNVELTLYGVNHIMPYESFLQLITEDWDENSITWENQPLATNENSISIAPTSDPIANYQLDLSNFVSAWKNGTINNGLLFRSGSEFISGTGYFEFASSDYPDAEMHPKLEITYTAENEPRCPNCDLGLGFDPYNCGLTDINNPIIEFCKGETIPLTIFLCASDCNYIMIDFNGAQENLILQNTTQIQPHFHADLNPLNAGIYRIQLKYGNTQNGPWTLVNHTVSPSFGISSFIAKVHDLSNATFTPNYDPGCAGHNITLTATPNNPVGNNLPEDYGIYWYKLPENQLIASQVLQVNVSPTVSTEYRLEIENDYCSKTITKLVNVVNSIPVYAFASVPFVCAGNSATLSATSGTNYSYQWSPSTGLNNPNIQNPTATPTITTLYKVSVANGTGCTGSDAVYIGVIPNTPIEFSFNKFDNCEELSTQFTIPNELYLLQSYTWDFGDETTLTSQNQTVNHIYRFPGYFKVTLTDECGTSVEKIIQINPSVQYQVNIGEAYKNYNPNCCIKNYTGYTVWDDIEINGANGTIETWDNQVGPKRIKGTLTIKQGYTLNINNYIIEFGPQGKIIVENGAKLNITNSTLTSIDFKTACGTSNPMRMMWQGIELWGNTAASSNDEDAQGKLVINNSIIEDAHNGVIVGKPEFATNNEYPNVFKFNAHNANYNEGILQVTNSKFNRNARSIQFWDNAYTQKTKIENNTFTSKTSINSSIYCPVIDPYYYGEIHAMVGNKFFYIPTDNGWFTPQNESDYYHNPFYWSAWGYQTQYFTPTHIQFYQFKNVKIIDNIFENANIAILSTNSSLNVLKSNASLGNHFKNNYCGIRVTNTQSDFTSLTIKSNQFTNNAHAIDVNCANYCIFDGNFFRDLGAPSYIPFLEGINTVCSKNLTITDNNFQDMTHGVTIYNSGNQTSYLGKKIKPGGNLFNANINPFSTGDVLNNNSDNTGLIIRCNGFSNREDNKPITGPEYKSNWYINSAFSDQGAPIVDTKSPAGNTFEPLTQREVKTNTPFNYYAHAELYTQPVPIGPLYVHFNSAILYNTQSCDITPYSGDITLQKATISEINSKISIIEQERIAVISSIDNEQTTLLLAAINSNTSAGSLRSLLLSTTLLSDTVLISAIERRNALPPGILKDIILPNSPVSNNVANYLNPKLDFLPNGIKKQIAEAQAVSGTNRTLTAINRELLNYKNEKGIILNDLINQYLEIDSVQAVKDLLSVENNDDVKRILLAVALSEDNVLKSKELLNQLPINTSEDIAFRDLYQLYIDLKLSNKTYWDLNFTQRQQIKSIASDCPPNLASLNAKALLEVVYGENVGDCNTNQQLFRVSNKTVKGNDSISFFQKDSQFNKDLIILGNNTPNPFSNKTIIPYYLPNGFLSAELQICDLSGKIIEKMVITNESNYIEINLDYLENGLYLYHLVKDGKILSSKRMVIIK